MLGAGGDYLHYETMCDAVREMLRCWHRPGQALWLRLISLRQDRRRHLSVYWGPGREKHPPSLRDRDDPLHPPNLGPPPQVRPLPVRRGQAGPLQIRLPQPPRAHRLGLGLGDHQPGLSSQHQGQEEFSIVLITKQLWWFTHNEIRERKIFSQWDETTGIRLLPCPTSLSHGRHFQLVIFISWQLCVSSGRIQNNLLMLKLSVMSGVTFPGEVYDPHNSKN